MSTPYTKPALTVAQQLELLRGRGLRIESEAAATLALTHKGYYRLSAYWYPSRKKAVGAGRQDVFEDGASFDDTLRLYEFDRQIRLTLLDAIERVEVSIRTAVTYHFAHAAGPFGYADAKQFDVKLRHAEWLQRVDVDIERSREDFIDHFRTRYTGFPRVPLWMATEVISFGSLSQLVGAMLPPVLIPMARAFGVHDVVLKNWVHALSVLRNLCAHHARVWNRQFGVIPKLPRHDPRWLVPDPRRMFPLMLVLRHLLRTQQAGTDWATRMETIIEPIAGDPRHARSMGLPLDWKRHRIWSGV